MRMTIVATQVVLERSVRLSRDQCHWTEDVTIRFLYSSEACSTALSQIVRRLPDVDVLEIPLRSSWRYRVGRPKAISSSCVYEEMNEDWIKCVCVCVYVRTRSRVQQNLWWRRPSEQYPCDQWKERAKWVREWASRRDSEDIEHEPHRCDRRMCSTRNARLSVTLDHVSKDPH